MPTVSVVIPAFNGAVTLPDTLRSLSAQTFVDFEAIVVDDGSTDGTLSVVAAAGDERITAVSIPNGGVAAARNHGIARTAADFVAFLDADDIWEPDKLARQLDALASDPQPGFCVTGALRIDGDSKVIGVQPLEQPDDVCRTLLLDAMAVGYISSGLARRSVLEAVGGFDPDFSYCADWDLWLRLAVATRFAIIDTPLMRYRTSEGNMSSNAALLERDTFAVLDAFFRTPAASRYKAIRPEIYANHWMYCAGSYLHQGRPGDATRCVLRGIAVHPSSVARPLGLPARWIGRAARRLEGQTDGS